MYRSRVGRFKSSAGALNIEYLLGAMFLLAAIVFLGVLLQQIAGNKVTELNRTEQRLVPCADGNLNADRCK